MTHSDDRIRSDQVHQIIRRCMLADGMDMVLDMKRSEGAYLIDAATERRYVDFFTFFASNPLGMNHPGMRTDEAFIDRLLDAALNKVSNSDIYTLHMARFVNAFGRMAMPSAMVHCFFISGGGLAVENALKAAFDWKVRKNFQKGYRREVGSQVLHLERAFHGRTGYTMSLTNTDPWKVAYFPKFDWPRILSPDANGLQSTGNLEQIVERENLAVEQAKRHFVERKDEIAAIVLEPIQGEGGDNHFRPDFLARLRQLADENEALLIFDEVQSGFGLTGSFWAYQGLGVDPDIVAFGKKAQVCGVMASARVDEVADNVFRRSSRINSTWGGNLVDMVRSERILQIIEEERLVDNAAQVGAHLLKRLMSLSGKYDFVENPRGRGLMCAFDLPCAGSRDAVKAKAYELGLVVLGCGTRTIRFRPALTIGEATVDEGIEILDQALAEVSAEGVPAGHPPLG